jgi:uncharacterized protein
MQLHDTKTGLQVLDRKRCLELLATHHLARLGVIEGRHPVVLPINYVLDGDAPVMVTTDGVKSRSAGGRPACLEIDGTDVDRQTGWSVVVHGRLEDVTDDSTVSQRVTPPVPWAPGPHPYVLRLVPESITGRAIGL